jgi:C-terminal processing protease CtpA/Prc
MKMKKILIILLAACFMVSCDDANSRYVKKAVRIMDKNGIYAQGPEWEKAKEEALSAQPSSLKEAQEIVLKAGKVAGGKHTYLMTAEEVNDNDTSGWEMPKVELLENNVAYIKLPAFSGNAEEGARYANTVLDAIPDALQGVIIDLRGNRGGNMYPMIAAVHRFLPDDVILKFSSRKRPMSINTFFVMNSVGITEQSPVSCPVALLTDEWTGSSGEAVLICFRGLPNTRTFGSPTAGYCSCNQPFVLPGGSQLVLTIGEDIARTGEAFCDDPIAPDVLTETPFEDAVEWLNNQEIR